MIMNLTDQLVVLLGPTCIAAGDVVCTGVVCTRCGAGVVIRGIFTMYGCCGVSDGVMYVAIFLIPSCQSV